MFVKEASVPVCVVLCGTGKSLQPKCITICVCLCACLQWASFSSGPEEGNTLFLWPSKQTNAKYVATEITYAQLMRAEPL